VSTKSFSKSPKGIRRGGEKNRGIPRLAKASEQKKMEPPPASFAGRDSDADGLTRRERAPTHGTPAERPDAHPQAEGW